VSSIESGYPKQLEIRVSSMGRNSIRDRDRDVIDRDRDRDTCE